MEAVLRAMADEGRRRLLGSLAEGPATAGESATLLPIARPGVSRHLRVLREAGLVEVHQEAQRRIYSLRPAPLAEVDQWLDRYRRLWSSPRCAAHRGGPGKREQRRPDDKRRESEDAASWEACHRSRRGRVRIEDRYDTGIDDHWSGITDPTGSPAGLARWMVSFVKGAVSVCTSPARESA